MWTGRCRGDVQFSLKSPAPFQGEGLGRGHARCTRWTMQVHSPAYTLPQRLIFPHIMQRSCVLAPAGPRVVATGGSRLQRLEPVDPRAGFSCRPGWGDGITRTSQASSAPSGRALAITIVATGSATPRATSLHPWLQPRAPLGHRTPHDAGKVQPQREGSFRTKLIHGAGAQRGNAPDAHLHVRQRGLDQRRGPTPGATAPR